MTKKLSSKQIDILNYIIDNTSIESFNKAVEDFNVQRLYTLLENSISARFFDNDKLRASVFVSAIFNQFQSQEQELRSNELKKEILKLQKEIKFKSRFKKEYSNELIRYDILNSEYNELNRGFYELRKIYKSWKKKMIK